MITDITIVLKTCDQILILIPILLNSDWSMEIHNISILQHSPAQSQTKHNENRFSGHLDLTRFHLLQGVSTGLQRCSCSF